MNETIKDIPVMKTFSVGDNYYVYDTYTNQILNVSKECFAEVQQLAMIGREEYQRLQKNTSAYNSIRILLHRGYFREPFIRKIEHPHTKHMDILVKRDINELVLQVTRDCNFKCRYCLFTRENEIDRQHEKVHMSWETAKKCVDYLYANSKDANEVSISFYGGEPLLNFDLIQKVVIYAEGLFQSKSVRFTTTINGSLLSEKVSAFLAEHNISVGISLDGGEEIQNRHRKFYESGGDTFDVVYHNVLRLREMNPKYFEEQVSFQPVYFGDEDPEEVKKFFIEFCVNEKKVSIRRASTGGVDYLHSGIYEYEKEKGSHSDSETIFPDIEKYEQVYLDKRKISEVWHHGGPCVPGIRRLFVDTHGDFYPCEKVLENPANRIGSLEEGLDIAKAKEILNIGRLSEDDCRRCWAARFCSICISKCMDVEGTGKCNDSKKYACRTQKNDTLFFLKHRVSEVKE